MCVTVTHLDGLVLARSAFHHSMNYRSVMVLGIAEEVVGAAAKRRALHRLSEHLLRGRWADARKPTSRELRGTAVFSLAIDEASANLDSRGGDVQR